MLRSFVFAEFMQCLNEVYVNEIVTCQDHLEQATNRLFTNFIYRPAGKRSKVLVHEGSTKMDQNTKYKSVTHNTALPAQ